VGLVRGIRGVHAPAGSEDVGRQHTPSLHLLCDSLAASAKDVGIFLDGRSGVSPGQLSPGSLFLVRRTPLDWVHTGLVLSIAPSAFETIEGNTNDSGDREGYEVCRRTRGYDGKDFVVIA